MSGHKATTLTSTALAYNIDTSHVSITLQISQIMESCQFHKNSHISQKKFLRSHEGAFQAICDPGPQNLNHKIKCQFFEIEIYTSSESRINKMSIDVWFVRIRQYLAEI